MNSTIRRTLVASVCAAAVGGAAAVPAASASGPDQGHLCKYPGYSAVKFVYAVNGTLPNATVKVRDAKVYCGGPDDGHWDPTGKPHTMKLTANPTVKLIPSNAKSPEPVKATFGDLVTLAKVGVKDKQFGYFGGAYGVKINSQGQISALTELFHP